MASTGNFALRPDDVVDATKALDELAERVDKLMAAEAPNLSVTASGADEVSVRVAHTLNEVHGKFGAATAQGVNEIREVAATLRAHTNGTVAADADFTV